MFLVGSVVPQLDRIGRVTAREDAIPTKVCYASDAMRPQGDSRDWIVRPPELKP